MLRVKTQTLKLQVGVMLCDQKKMLETSLGNSPFGVPVKQVGKIVEGTDKTPSHKHGFSRREIFY